MDSEPALRSASTVLYTASRVQVSPLTPWPDGGPESLRSRRCGLAMHKTNPNPFTDRPHLERFYATPYSIVLKENHKALDKVEPDRCAQACLEETTFVCRSFDYQVSLWILSVFSSPFTSLTLWQ
ncbi:hypothetical protein PoB_001671600 [Plakobranchus ocellatus]|uniref:Apple domain-containing protein n=1 Tax=Plakobranchus ocellatus TaxID=259542 RepID=A0AAV3Z2W6_9GAST|nr:hypothetical protein PoB_001671600 [Plakobranchus ocellatus]